MKTNIKKTDNIPVDHLQDETAFNIRDEHKQEEVNKNDDDISDLDADIMMYMINI